MKSDQLNAMVLEDVKVDVKLKLSALWAALMFIYLYVDIFGFYKPGSIENILAGQVWEFDITQSWALSAMTLMTIPSLMVFLAMALPAKVNRWTNIVVAILYIVVSIGNVVGETWAYFFLGAGVESMLLVLIVWHAWKWPSSLSERARKS